MAKIKVFSVYHRPYEIFRSDCIEPIQVGCANNKYDLGFLRDDTGDNISQRNGGYCELTAQYWVWKNYLPLHPELEYIGFCHYRRYMDFWNKNDFCEDSFFNYRYMDTRSFSDTIFEKCVESEILSVLPTGTDIVLPEAYLDKRPFSSILNLYKFSFGGLGVKECLEVVKSDYPDWLQDFRDSMNSKSAYHCLTFMMKRDVFERYAQWIFDFLFKVENKLKDNPHYKPTGRLEGYLGELFFNLWIHHEIRVNKVKVNECGGVFLDAPASQLNYNRIRCFFKKIAEFFARIKAYLWSRSLLRGCDFLK